MYLKPLEAEANDYLSVSEATTLGVAFGTTRQEAMNMGITAARWKGTTGSETKTGAPIVGGETAGQEELSWLNSALDEAANIFIEQEQAGGGSQASYDNLVNEFATDLNISNEDADAMIRRTISAKKGITKQSEVFEDENIASDFSLTEALASGAVGEKMWKGARWAAGKIWGEQHEVK